MTGSDLPGSTVLANRARKALPAEYRGEGRPFGDIVPVPDDAPVLDQLAGFMGRRP